MFSFCKETRGPISRWKVGPVATEAAAAKHKYPARKPVVLDVFFSKPVVLDTFCLKIGCSGCFFSELVVLDAFLSQNR